MRILLFGVILLAGLGCASARLVSVDREGGVVAVPSRSPRHIRKAQELMAQEAPNGFDIVKEGETSAGLPIERVETSSNSHGGIQTTSYQEQKEWWIWFKKR